MIDFFTAGTPNGHKVAIALEELALPYRLHALDLRKSESKTPDFLRINPNGKIPAIVDNDGNDGAAPITVFESGAILIYLAEKTGKLLAPSGQARYEALAWLMFQMSAIGPIFGQVGYFTVFAKEKVPHAIDRFVTEGKRIVKVLDDRLADREYLAGDYSIADIASYPWMQVAMERMNMAEGAPHAKRWLDRVGARPAVQKGMTIPPSLF